jgi:DNA uptake protein ComE-like DNA-binding protein
VAFDERGLRRVDDLEAVPGIGPATVAMMRGWAMCGSRDDEGDRAASRTASAVGAPATVLPVRIDINRADVDGLLALPGMYRSRAEAIVAERARGGPFASCSDLVRVQGLGPATVVALEPSCVVSPSPP